MQCKKNDMKIRINNNLVKEKGMVWQPHVFGVKLLRETQICKNLVSEKIRVKH